MIFSKIKMNNISKAEKHKHTIETIYYNCDELIDPRDGFAVAGKMPKKS